MSVNLRRFVDIDIKRMPRNVVNPVRDTIVLFNSNAYIISTDTQQTATYCASTNVTASDTVVIFDNGYVSDDGTKYVVEGYLPESKAARKVEFVIETSVNPFYFYARSFFDNGGMKIKAIDTVTITAETLRSEVEKEEILVAKIGNLTADEITSINAYLNSNDPVNTVGSTVRGGSSSKLFLTHIGYTGSEVSSLDAFDLIKDAIALKLGTQGIEMTVAAYLTKTNAYDKNAVNDYAFTIESVVNDSNFVSIFNDDELVGDCLNKNVMVDTVLASQVRNVGGDLLDGSDIVNYYMTIVMQQTLEETVVNALSQKLKGADGTAIIANVIMKELNKYVESGLLAAGNWNDSDWVVSYNDRNYTVVSANERLSNGYNVLVVPFAALTAEQVAAHMCPPIYIAMTNAYGIRKITIFGEVI